MAYKTSAVTDSIYIEQFLNVASAGNVFVEFAVSVSRYRLCCRKCLQTLTYAEGFGVDGTTVDQSLQDFAKGHRHEKVKDDLVGISRVSAGSLAIGNGTTGDGWPPEVPKQVSYTWQFGTSTKYPLERPKDSKPVMPPRKTSGRKFR
jgi:hypothetical protein